MGGYWQLLMMKPGWYILFQVFLLGGYEVEGARILGLFPFPAPSHYKQGAKLMQELSKRGHEVTIVASYTQSYENITEIVVQQRKKIIRNAMKISPFYKKDVNYFELIDESWLTIMGNAVFSDFLAMYIIEEMFTIPEIVTLLKMDFDLVVADAFAGESLIGFAYKFDCPYIILNPIASSLIVNDWVSNPSPYSYVPLSVLHFKSEMTLWQRLINTWVGYNLQVFKDYYHLPKQEKLLKKFFKGSPGLHELFDKHLSLILLNSNLIINHPQPMVPSIIEIGGFHVDAPKPLPQDLQEFLDGAEHGVILLSFGSILKSIELPLDKRDAFVKALSKLKQKVIWKYENDTLPGKPPNVKISKWLPINDILAHPNLKVFITHAGLLSTIEAIHHGVPILGVPVAFDQFWNIFKAVNEHYALAVPFQQLSEESLGKALEEILGNASYGESARKLSALLKDQPMGALDKAIFWVEHVLRNGGQHLRTAGDKLHWTQLHLLDVLLCIFLFHSFWIFMAVWCCRRMSKKREKLKYN